MVMNNLDGKKHYWLMPSELMESLRAEFNFDFDACPYPRPRGFNGLSAEWGQSNWVNPPFMGSVLSWVRKAIMERDKGKVSVLMLPLFQPRAIAAAGDAGAEIRYAGKPRCLAIEDQSPNPATPSNLTPCLFLIFRPEQCCRIAPAEAEASLFDPKPIVHQTELYGDK